MSASTESFRQIAIDLKIKTGCKNPKNKLSGYIRFDNLFAFLQCFKGSIDLMSQIYFEMRAIHFQYGPGGWKQCYITFQFVGGSAPDYFSSGEHKYKLLLPISVYEAWVGISRITRISQFRPKVTLSEMDCTELFFHSATKVWSVEGTFQNKLWGYEHSQFYWDLWRLKKGYPKRVGPKDIATAPRNSKGWLLPRDKG